MSADTDDPTRVDPGATQIETGAHAGSADAVIGRELSGKYQVIEKLGQGGMGAVFKAKHRKLGRMCAVKILPPELARDASMVKRFEQEARATAALDQHNVVTIFDVDSDLGYEYLAMEFIQGESLDDRLRRDGALPWRKAVELARQAACGLRAAHEAGIIHRDIKPANLMLTREEVVKVMDFGLARLAEAMSHLSRTGQILGTPHYMSPEQAEAREVDLRTDIYSLGATLYLMVTGSTPFNAPTPTALLLKVVQQDPLSPEELNASVPAPVSAVILKMMARDADHRQADMSAVIADLDKLLAGEAPDAEIMPTLPAAPATAGPTEPTAALPVMSAATPAPAPPPVPSLAAQSHRTRWIIAGGAIIIAILGALASGDNKDDVALDKLKEVLTQTELSAEAKVAACDKYMETYSDSEHVTEVEALRTEWQAKVDDEDVIGPGFGLGKHLKGIRDWGKSFEKGFEHVPEGKARAKLETLVTKLELYLQAGKRDKAKEKLEEFISEYEGTEAADAAQKILDGLENAEDENP